MWQVDAICNLFTELKKLGMFPHILSSIVHLTLLSNRFKNVFVSLSYTGVIERPHPSVDFVFLISPQFQLFVSFYACNLALANLFSDVTIIFYMLDKRKMVVLLIAGPQRTLSLSIDPNLSIIRNPF